MLFSDSTPLQQAADQHNIGASNSSWFDDVSSAIGHTPDFALSAVASAAVSFANTGIAAYNLFQAPVDKTSQLDTYDVLASQDNNLADYYKQHQTAADTVGFLVGSLIPGGAAVKGLHAGQAALEAAIGAGKFGANISRAVSLLTPSVETFVSREGAELAARSATYNIASANSLRAIAAGAWQGTLDTLAFETAVNTTMYKSPVYDGQTLGDRLQNTAVWAGVGAGFGAIGALGKSYFGIQKLLKNADARQRVVTGSTELSEAASDSDWIAAHLDDIKAAKSVSDDQLYDFVYAQKTAAGETGLSVSVDTIQSEVANLKRLRDDHIAALNNEINKRVTSLAKGDNQLGNFINDTLARLPDDAKFSAYFNASRLSRVGDITETEKAAKKLAKETGISEKDAYAQLNMQETNIRLHSGNVGDVVKGGVGSLRIADKAGMTADKIDKLVKSYGFSAKDATDYAKITDGELAEARWIWARSLPSASKLWNAKIGDNDLPLLWKAMNDKVDAITLTSGRKLETAKDIKDYYHQTQQNVLAALKPKNRGLNFLERTTNLRREFISGKSLPSADPEVLFDAVGSYANDLSKYLGKDVSPSELMKLPSFAKVTTNTAKVFDVDGNEIRGMNLIAYRSKVYQDGVNNVFARFAGNVANSVADITDADLRKAWRGGSGSGFATNAGGAYGSLEQKISYLGGITNSIKRAKIKAVNDTLAPVGTAFGTDSQDAVRFSGINSIITNAREHYVLDDAGDNLIPKKVKDWIDAGEEGEFPTLAEGTVESIPLTTPGVKQAVLAHIALNDARTQHWIALNAANGNVDRKIEGIFAPIRPNPRTFKHVAFVKDNSVVGVGHTSMVFGQTAEELEKKIAKIRSLSPTYKVFTKNDAENFYKARGEYEYSKTLHDNYLDTDLKAKGVWSDSTPSTDPRKVMEELVDYHVRSESALVNEMVLSRHAKAISELTKLGKLYANIPSSLVGTAKYDALISDTKNPYFAQIKNLLDISKSENIPSFWKTINQGLDEKFTAAYNKADEVLRGAKYYNAETVKKVNEAFEEVGFKSSFDGAMNALANTPAASGKLSQFVRAANSFLSSTILRWDPFNALVNGAGNQILLQTELRSLIEDIKKGSEAGAGELAQLANITLPGVDQEIFSANKVLARSYKKLFTKEGQAIAAQLKDVGIDPNLHEQILSALDNIAEGVRSGGSDAAARTSKLYSQWKKLSSIGDKLEVYSGNRVVEHLNRVSNALAAKEITDIAVKHGIIDANTAMSYINTFVNRVNGVVRASERPLAFQGPVGQAIGLFQSYQFNLMQQLLRYVGEGKPKSLAMLGGLQASLFGGSSLPGFNLINTNIIGEAAGNEQHNDIYSTTQAIFGKRGAEWLMYGAPSNLLNAAIYTRGDTNPRTWSVVPNPANPAEIPFINAFAQAFSSIHNAVGKIENGAPVWDSLLTGIEHMGLSRPLAGLAQVLKGNSTQLNGNFVSSNDLVSWATLTRLAGAKPLDDATIMNAYYRTTAYEQADRAKREQLGQALKQSFQSGGEISSSQAEEFAAKYAAWGGSQTGFNQWWMNQYKNATKSQAEQLSEKLNTDAGRRMQYLMGGRDNLDDIYGTGAN